MPTLDHREYTGHILDSVMVASDPFEGRFWTAVSSVKLAGIESAVLNGFCTGVSRNQELVDRSVGEAVERAVWWDLHDRAGNVGSTTAGCAVHPDRGLAAELARQEAIEKHVAIARFDMRDLGVLYAPSRSYSSPQIEERFWVDTTNAIVMAGTHTPGTFPALLIASAGIGADRDLERAAQHARAEIAQVRPWLRAVHGSLSDSAWKGEAASRIRWWSEADEPLVSRTWSQLNEGARGSALKNPGSAELTHTARIQLDGRELWFARAELSTLEMRQHDRAIKADSPEPVPAPIF